jgi:hypothetical protein
MALYVLAKIAEVLDHQIANALGFVTGHTLKHLIATTVTAAVVWGLTRRFSAPSPQGFANPPHELQRAEEFRQCAINPLH